MGDRRRNRKVDNPFSVEFMAMVKEIDDLVEEHFDKNFNLNIQFEWMFSHNLGNQLIFSVFRKGKNYCGIVIFNPDTNSYDVLRELEI